MGLIILDKSPKACFLSKDNIKHFSRFLLRKVRGPQSLIVSLLLGLDELNYKYKYNPKCEEILENDIIYVTGSISALKFAIDLKRRGKIKKLIAGPTLVVTPDDYGGIIKDKNIDIYITPSPWTKDFYSSFGDKDLNSKLRIWAAGVSLSKKLLDVECNFSCILYNKVPNSTLPDKIEKYLKELNIPVNKIDYGKYDMDEYFNLLQKSSFMIYFSEVESQGIALLEAWANNVPTLVWNNDSYTFKKIGKTITGSISAPYLNDACGIFFEKNNYREKIDYFIKNLNYFHPREYVKENFTNKICAQKLINIINK